MADLEQQHQQQQQRVALGMEELSRQLGERIREYNAAAEAR